MPSIKRTLEQETGHTPSKRVHLNPDELPHLTQHVPANLTATPEEDIQGSDSAAQVDDSTTSPSSTSPPASLSDAKLAKRVEKARVAMFYGIRKRMTWKPACNDGSSVQFNYQANLSSIEIFYGLTGQPANAKQGKTEMSFGMQDFEEVVVGSPNLARLVRKKLLVLSEDENITVSWNEGLGQISVSGFYGALWL